MRGPRPSGGNQGARCGSSAPPRGTWLARRLAGQRLDVWGILYDFDTSTRTTR
ncbi:hypothetical protein AB0I51_45870 [Streptomyces sp. NPDC050549]|uniref:hypothetical protein n=1 Tax=Streptomyces sp. NPDC050549 TaxID=3155406 RepID=UPI003445AE8C